MDDGKITESGAYSELMDNNGAFAEFIRHYSTMGDNEEGDPCEFNTKILLRKNYQKLIEMYPSKKTNSVNDKILIWAKL